MKATKKAAWGLICRFYDPDDEIITVGQRRALMHLITQVGEDRARPVIQYAVLYGLNPVTTLVDELTPAERRAFYAACRTARTARRAA